ncbi:MAG: hypothetical protein KAH03_00805 [Cocleimonas sp.]|nr:hypothetical protein [Cocleimonas sp.]
MRQLVLLSSLCILTACSGDNLDSPIKTCQAVTAALLGTPLPATMQTRQHESSETQTVMLDFQLSDEKKTMNVVCTYKTALVGEDSGVELIGKFERVPSGLIINGKNTPREALFKAINNATVTAGKKVAQETNEFLQKQ